MKSLFILFFSIFSLNLSSEAMAAATKIIGITSATLSTECDSKCGSMSCTAINDINTVSCTDLSSTNLICTQLTTAGVALLKPTCISKCLSCISRFKMGSAYIEDAESNISKNAFTKTACNALRIVTGGAGKTFATFAVIATGIGFFTGKVSWGLMIGVAAGIATMFGGPSIVAAISGQDTSTMCNIQD